MSVRRADSAPWFWVYAGVLGAVAAWRVWLMIPGAFDLGHQVWAVTVVGSDGFEAVIPWSGLSAMGTHFSILLPLLYAFSALPGFPIVLVVLQAGAIGLSGWLVWRFAVSRTERGVAALITAGVMLHPATLYAALWDVHMNVLGLPLLVAFAVAVASADSRSALIWGCLASLAREDLALIVIAVALVNVPRIGRRTAIGLSAIAAGVVTAWLTIGGSTGAVSIFGFVDVSDPLGTVLRAFENLSEGGYVISLVTLLALPWMFLGKPDWRLVLPVIITHVPLLFSDTPVTRSIGFHYYTIATFAIGIGVAARSDRSISTRHTTFRLSPSSKLFAGLAVLVLLVIVGPFGTSAVSREYTRNSVVGIADGLETRMQTAAEMHRAIACVRNEEAGTVAAEGSYVPWLHDVELRLLPHPFEDLLFASGRSSVVLLKANSVKPDVLVTTAANSVIPDDYTRDPNLPLVAWSDDERRCETDETG